LYYRAFWHILVAKGSYDDLRTLCKAPRIDFWSKYNRKDTASMTPDEENCLFTAVWLHTLALTLDLWNKPHYRADSYKHDMVANFSNIAFPGTGIPLSWVCCCKSVAILYFLLFHPLVILVEAIVLVRSPIIPHP